jgi:hypothetical protein
MTPVVPNLSKVVYMIYDASTPSLPRERRGVQHASFDNERVARDLVLFEPHGSPGSYCLLIGTSMAIRIRVGLKRVPGGFETRPYVRLQGAASEAFAG